MKMREKAKELQRQRVESTKRGIKPPMSSSGGGGGGYGPSPVASSIPTEPNKPSYQPSAV